MIADQDAINGLRRAILAHIRDLVDDLDYWADQLEALERGNVRSDPPRSSAEFFAAASLPPLAGWRERRPSGSRPMKKTERAG